MKPNFKKPFFFPYLCAFVLTLFYFFFNLLYMQQFVDYDQVVYVSNTYYSMNVPWSERVYNPHHIHMSITGVLFHEWMVEKFGDAGFTDFVFNLKLRSLLTACIGIFFIFLYFHDLTGKLIWGLLGGLLIGFTHQFIHSATKVDTAIFPLASFILILWVHNRIEKTKKYVIPLSVSGGVFLALSITMHQYMVIACAVACFTIMLPSYFLFTKRSISCLSMKNKQELSQINRKPGSRYSAFLILSLTGAILTLGAYFFVAKTQYNLGFNRPTPAVSHGMWNNKSLPQWLLGYATTNRWGQGITKFDFKKPLRGYTDGFLAQRNILNKYNKNYVFSFDIDDPLSKTAFSHNQMIYFTIFVLLGTIVLFIGLLRRYKRHFICLFLCTISYFTFFTYWEPHYLEFWGIPVVLICILGILILNYLGEKLSKWMRNIIRELRLT